MPSTSSLETPVQSTNEDAIMEPTERPREVYFFGTCLLDVIYPEDGLAAVELIEREGVRVIYPQNQTCCGQPAYNSGYRQEALEVARQQLDLFPRPLPIVVPSGSCGAMLHEHYPHLFAGTADETRARELASRVVEWSGFMLRQLRVTLKDRQNTPLRVAYHPSCHLLRDLKEREAPLALLRQLRGITLREIEDAEECCGFGGTFSVKQSDISLAMVQDKARAVRDSGVDVLVSSDAGCLMNIAGALHRQNRAPQTMTLPQLIKMRTMPPTQESSAERRA